jgi:tRNA(Ile)-lysidine synthase
VGGRLDPAVAEVRRAVRLGCADLDPGSRIVVACSGGADSMALAAATAFEARATGWLVGAAVVDHQLQPSSAEVAADVCERLRALGIESVEIHRVDVGGRGGPEAAARSARYEALNAHARRQDAVVLLGHTRDDQAETVLLGLLRGSGVRSLAGMPAVRGPFRRPLLHLSRVQTVLACEALDVQVWEDPHNADERYARVRVRRQVLPLLEQALGPGVTEALARTAGLARDDADALDLLAAELRDRASAAAEAGHLQVAVLAAALPALRRRALRTWVIDSGSPAGEVAAVHVLALDRLVTDWHGQRAVELPGHLAAHRSGGELVLVGPVEPDGGQDRPG